MRLGHTPGLGVLHGRICQVASLLNTQFLPNKALLVNRYRDPAHSTAEAAKTRKRDRSDIGRIGKLLTTVDLGGWTMRNDDSSSPSGPPSRNLAPLTSIMAPACSSC
jgi:hypothetical protein